MEIPKYIYVMNRDRVWGLESLLHSGSVSIADGLRGSVDLSVLHDIECAHGQRMGMVLHSAATRAGSDFKDDDKHKVKQTQAWGRRCGHFRTKKNGTSSDQIKILRPLL